MDYLTCAHGGRCFRAKDGTEVHVHGNAKRGRRRKTRCKSDCCRTPRRLERRRNRALLRNDF